MCYKSYIKRLEHSDIAYVYARSLMATALTEIFMLDLMYLLEQNRQFAKISQLCSPYLKYHLDLILFFSLNK